MGNQQTNVFIERIFPIGHELNTLARLLAKKLHRISRCKIISTEKETFKSSTFKDLGGVFQA